MEPFELLPLATTHVQGILRHSFAHDSSKSRALVVYDTDYDLTKLLTAAYRAALPEAEFMDFAKHEHEQIIAKFDALSPGDLVVLIQTGSFRLNKFRIRINLFNRGLHVIEHVHLHRNPPATWASYVAALNPDRDWYERRAKGIRSTLSRASGATITTSDGTRQATLAVGPLEDPKLNIGDYTGMRNVGGTFPIGEVFTEARDLTSLAGSAYVYAFADAKFQLYFPAPFRVDIEAGQVVGWGETAPAEFAEVVEMVRATERPMIREIGFGLNRGIDKENPLLDVTAYERVRGVHLSLGEKHSTYKKPGIRSHKARYHVDLFLATEEVRAGEEIIIKDRIYR